MTSKQRVVCGFLIAMISSTGCRYRPCNNCVAGPGPGGVLANWDGFGNARVAPPATSSYQVPTTGQPYYTPSATTATANNSQPIGTATLPIGPIFNSNALPTPNINNTNILTGPPTSAMPNQFGQPTTSQPINPPNGWRPADGSTGSGFYGPGAQLNPNGMNPTSFQPTAPDYRSTMVDERFDPTRMPATDATMVRAPTSLGPAGTWQTLNQVVGTGPMNLPGQFEFRSTPQIAMQNGFGAPTNPLQFPAVGYPNYNYASQSQPVVLAQASTSPESLARDPNYQAGWRDRNTMGTYLNR